MFAVVVEYRVDLAPNWFRLHWEWTLDKKDLFVLLCVCLMSLIWSMGRTLSNDKAHTEDQE